MSNIISIIDKLKTEQMLDESEFKLLLDNIDEESSEYLHNQAREVADGIFSNNIYVRGLIEFTNYCKNDCYYCGIRASNKDADRYRLSKEQMLDCAKQGYNLGFRTFVLQGGEDMSYSDDDIVDIVSSIRSEYEDVAITLSIGERSYEAYKKYFDAGADRYLLRHETVNEEHYNKLHPNSLSISNRVKCLENLKKIGYQVGTGIMVGSPYQTTDNIIEDLMFIKRFKPHMVGIGPYIAHKATPFADMENGTLELTLRLLSIIRLMMPEVLLPSTTALGTIDPKGRELGILAGANVVMPNLSPTDVRKKYMLYDNKICTGDEAAECKNCLDLRLQSIGYKIVVDKGDHVGWSRN